MKKIIISLLLLLSGGMVFILGSPYYSVFPTNKNQTYYLGLTVFFLLLSVILKRHKILSEYWSAPYALFMASAALLFMSTGVLNIHENTTMPVKDLALDKLSQFLHVVPVLVVLSLLAKGDLKSIFINRGRVKQSLTFGLISFGVFAVIGLVIGSYSPEGLQSLPTAIPWLLLFIFANATMEELWFRGIFLKDYERHIGRSAAILVTSLVFGASHINATYSFPGGGLVFGLVVFSLGLVSAYAMVKDDSLIGSVLFHAGYELMVIVPILATV